MSIFKTGYFVLLPKELTEELSEYVYKYLNTLITIDTSGTNIPLDDNFDAEQINLTNETNLNFHISVYLPSEYSNRNIDVIFLIEIQQLHAFLEEYISTHPSQLQFINDELVLNKNIKPDVPNYSVGLAYEGILRNLDQYSCINLYDFNTNLL